MGQTKAERFSKMEANVYAHGTIRKQGLIMLLIKKHLMAKFLKSVPATKQGKIDMKRALKRDMSLYPADLRQDIAEYKALGHLFFAMEEANDVNAGLKKVDEDFELGILHRESDNIKNHPLVKQAVEIYTDEHEENTKTL